MRLSFHVCVWILDVLACTVYVGTMNTKLCVNISKLWAVLFRN